MARPGCYKRESRPAGVAGLAEPDPAADVSGLDEVAKVMILSALVFGRPLTRADVSYRGIDDLPGQALDKARQRAAR